MRAALNVLLLGMLRDMEIEEQRMRDHVLHPTRNPISSEAFPEQPRKATPR